MARKSYLFTSESGFEGHPDKICDRISDTVLDAYLGAYSELRVGCETFATTNRVVIGGEVRGPDSVTPDHLVDLARSAIKDIGYEQAGFHWADGADRHSAPCAVGGHRPGRRRRRQQGRGAGDQGIMFGYACTETPELMPAPIHYAHLILRRLSEARHAKQGDAAKLGPDAKSQVTVRYENGKPVEAASIVLSTQHLDPSLSSEDVRSIVEPYIRGALPEGCVSMATPNGTSIPPANS